MLYSALINGADSIAFFGMTIGLTGRDNDLGFNWTWWRAVLQPLLAEIKAGTELYPVLTSPDSKYPLQVRRHAPGRIDVEGGWCLPLHLRRRPRRQTARSEFAGLQDGASRCSSKTARLRPETAVFPTASTSMTCTFTGPCERTSRPPAEPRDLIERGTSDFRAGL